MADGTSGRRSFFRGGAGFLAGSFVAPGQAPAAGPPHAAWLNVLDYGANGDGAAMNTVAFRRVMAACSAAHGGTVYVPAGRYLSGPIEVPANTTLYLEAGSVIQAAAELSAYPVENDPTSGESARAGLITARDAANVAIAGRGTIDGSGPAFMDRTRLHHGNDYDKRYTRQKEVWGDPRFGTEHGPWAHGERPGNVIRFLSCRNVLMDGITVQNSPTWTLQFHNCDDVSVNSVSINSLASERRVGNDDGIDLRFCRDVRITGCNINVGDDCIALFGSRRVAVSNCTLSSHSSGIRAGFDEGETRECVFSNLVIDSNRGLGVFVRGEGSVEDVLFSDIVMRTQLLTGHWWGKAEPVHVSAMPWSPRAAKLGRIRNVRFSNIVADSQAGIVVYGCPESVIEDVTLERVRLGIAAGPLTPSYGGNFDLRSTKDFSNALFEHDIPALFFRHVSGLKIDRLDLRWAGNLPPFFTHAIEGEQFRDIEIRGFEGTAARPDLPVIALRDGTGVSVRDCRALPGSGVFLAQQGVTGEGLFSGNDLAGARAPFGPAKNGYTMFGNRLKSS